MGAYKLKFHAAYNQMLVQDEEESIPAGIIFEE